MTTRTSRRSGSFGVGLRTTMRPSRLLLGIAAIAVLWEVAAAIVGSQVDRPDQVMPSLWYVFGTSTKELANYYAGGFGVVAPSRGGQVDLLTALLAVLDNSAITVLRVGIGLTLAVVVGTGLGLLMAGSRPVRMSMLGVAELLRMLPLLAMAPLFTLWFGATSTASVLFIAFAVGLVMLVGTINAIGNVPAPLLEYARTLGARRYQTYLRVVGPAIVPELRGPLVVSAALAWSISLASELFGIQSGLGWMMGQALRFSRVGQMVVIAMLFIVLAIVTIRLIDRVVRRLIRWHE